MRRRLLPALGLVELAAAGFGRPAAPLLEEELDVVSLAAISKLTEPLNLDWPVPGP